MNIGDLITGNVKDMDFPSGNDAGRLSDYARFRKMLLGEHEEIFEPNLEDEKRRGESTIDNYIVWNFAGLISRVASDFLFGEPITINSDKKTADKKIDEIVKRSNLHAKNAESALTQSSRGDVVVKARYVEGEGSYIEYVAPDLYFQETDPDNINELKYVMLGWKKYNGDDEYLRAEIHELGCIYNKLFKLKSNKIDYEVPLDMFYNNLDEIVETGIDKIPVKLITNFKDIDSEYGISDYYDLESLFKAINNRISMIDSVHDRHSDPILSVPKGVLDENGEVKRGSLKMFEISSDANQKPEYIVWDAKTDSAFKEVDLLISAIMAASETSTSILGMDKDGIAESGRALKFKMLRTIAKTKRKQRYYEESLKYIIDCALQFEKVTGVEVDIIWGDGIPTDEKEVAELNEILIRSGQMSEEEALRQRRPELDDKQIEEEMAKIKGSAEMDLDNVDINNEEE